MISVFFDFFYTTKENPDTKIVVATKRCKQPERTKAWKDLVKLKLPLETIKTVGYKYS